MRRSFGGAWLLARLLLPYLIHRWTRRWWHRREQSNTDDGKSLGKRGSSLERLHQRGAQRLYRYIISRGGLSIKIGQYLAARPDVMPTDYIEALSPLRDQVPARPLAELSEVLAEAYPEGWGEYFDHLEDQAIAAASFGQVHRGTTTSGCEVAIKIQYPGLEPSVRADLRIVRWAAYWLQSWLPGWSLQDMVAELERSALGELDYRREAAAADHLRPAMATCGVHVPRVMYESSRQRVLVTEWVAGLSLSPTTIAQLNQQQRQHICQRLCDALLVQVLEQRWFHADPHAGNLLITQQGQPQPQLWLIDYGMMGRISKREAALYARFLWCVRREDTDGMVDVLDQLAHLSPDCDREALRDLARKLFAEVKRGMASSQGDPEDRLEAQLELAQQVSNFLRHMQGVQLPGHSLFLSRALGLVEGLAIELLPGTTLLDAVQPVLARRINQGTLFASLWQLARHRVETIVKLPDNIAALRQEITQLRNKHQARNSFPNHLITITGALTIIAALQLSPGLHQYVIIAVGLVMILRR